MLGIGNCACFLLTALAGVGGARHYTYTAPIEKVVLHADLVVRGTFDPPTGRIEVAKHWGDAEKLATIHVHNAASLPAPIRKRKKKLDVVLFLRRIDDRYYLPVSSGPDWVSPHAAIKVLEGNKAFGLYHAIDPGPLGLRAERYTADQLFARLDKHLSKQLQPLAIRFLKSPARERFYAAVEPWIDYYEQRLVHEPDATRLAELIARISDLVDEKPRSLSLRAVDSLLILGNQQGADQSRRKAVEAKLISLSKQLGYRPLMPALIAALESRDIRANKRSAARVIRAIGGRHVEPAKKRLIEILKTTKQTNLRTNAYFALVYLGFEAEADKLIAEHR